MTLFANKGLCQKLMNVRENKGWLVGRQKMKVEAKLHVWWWDGRSPRHVSLHKSAIYPLLVPISTFLPILVSVFYLTAHVA